jgi:hypothetical protein
MGEKESLMTHANKGLVLSGLVFPGLGQVMLKRYMRGAVLMLAVAVGVVSMAAEAARTALDALARIDIDSGTIGLDEIMRAARQAASHTHTWVYIFSLFLILFAWLFSAVDAYRIGKSLDRSMPPNPPR